MRSGHDAVDLCEEAVTPRQLLPGGVFEVEKALLHEQLDGARYAMICRKSCQQAQLCGGMNQSYKRSEPPLMHYSAKACIPKRFADP